LLFGSRIRRGKKQGQDRRPGLTNHLSPALTLAEAGAATRAEGHTTEGYLEEARDRTAKLKGQPVAAPQVKKNRRRKKTQR
jgi:hypothetical protein